jgi:hypothetical protein
MITDSETVYIRLHVSVEFFFRLNGEEKYLNLNIDFSVSDLKEF